MFTAGLLEVWFIWMAWDERHELGHVGPDQWPLALTRSNGRASDDSQLLFLCIIVPTHNVLTADGDCF